MSSGLSQHAAIAIDGPAASGKSSVARRVARRFGFRFINSGAMYRAFAWHVLESGIDPADRDAVIRLLAETEFQCGVRDGASTIGVNGRELDQQLLSADAVNAAVSPVAAIAQVRERLVAEQRRYREVADVVMEGRDIGTVVFPDTLHKFYLDASPEVRAKRRADEGIVDDIVGRDRQDSSRKTAPLSVAADATVIDTSDLNLEQVVDAVAGHLRAQGLREIEPEDPYKPNPMGLIYRIGYLIFWGIGKALYNYKIVHPERARLPGGCVIAANHVSFMDPPLVGMAFPEGVYFVARKTLYGHPIANWLYAHWNGVPLDQEKADLSSLRAIIKLVRGGKKVILYPEGERSFSGEPLRGQRGVGMIIAKTKQPVIPVRIFGAHDVFPRGSNHPNLHGKITVVIGEPIYFSEEELTSKDVDTYQKIADRVMDVIAALKDAD